MKMITTSKKQSRGAPVKGMLRTPNEVRAALRAAGCRYTAQRQAVYAYLEQVEHHPTAEQVYRAVRRRIPQISLATVYNALEALVESQLANRLTNGAGSARYDCGGDDHYHLRDLKTGEVRDLPIEFDRQLLNKLDPRLMKELARDGFTVTGYRLEVVGRFEQ
ncbi:MAG TPA: transcriptional repressor [Pirellulales bacterium]|jgi:Fe2+ or Zn2+ uptake regulation protein